MTTILAGIARSSLLVDLSISTYAGRVQDKTTRDEVTASKGARSKRAASVYKSLFADCAELSAITSFQANLRIEHYRLTKPWSDSGLRLVTYTLLERHRDLMYHAEQDFWKLVDVFLDKYDTLVAAAAFQLGALFDRTQYPTREQVRRKFGFHLHYTPLPKAGDFRIDIENEVQQDLAKQFNDMMAERERVIMQDSWDKLHAAISRIVKQLAPREGRRGKIYETLVTDARDLCDLLGHFNVTGDAKLDKVRRDLEDMLTGITADALRTEEDTRAVVHNKAKALLDSYEWGMGEISEDDFADAA